MLTTTLGSMRFSVAEFVLNAIDLVGRASLPQLLLVPKDSVREFSN